jgi:hypothetical protein
VREVTGVASNAFAPATLAGRAVQSSLSVTWGYSRDGRTCSLALLFGKSWDANSATALITVLTAPFFGEPELQNATRLFGSVSSRRPKRGYSCLYLNAAHPSTLPAVRQFSGDGVRHHPSGLGRQADITHRDQHVRNESWLCENAKTLNRDKRSYSSKTVLVAQRASGFNLEIELNNIILPRVSIF